MSVYTKTGDSGETGLFGNARVRKDSPVTETTGTIDELNGHTGVVAALVVGTQQEPLLRALQSDLFSIGAALSGAPMDLSPLSVRVSELEAAIDGMDASLPTLANFILPGPSEEVARIHIARSVCRRAERRAVTLFHTGGFTAVTAPDRAAILRVLNRLSDYLFVLARYLTVTRGDTETAWKGKMK